MTTEEYNYAGKCLEGNDDREDRIKAAYERLKDLEIKLKAEGKWEDLEDYEDPNYMVVYVITKLKSGKQYVGQKVHMIPSYYGSGLLMNSKIVKRIGKENVMKEITRHCKSKEMMNYYEMYYILEYDTYDSFDYDKQLYGLNQNFGGGNTFGWHPSNATKLKQSIALKDYFQNPRAKEKISGENHYNYGKHLSDKHKQQISNAIKGEKHPMYGKHHSPESKELIRKNHANFRGKNHPKYGKQHSLATRELISKSWQDKRLKITNELFNLLTNEPKNVQQIMQLTGFSEAAVRDHLRSLLKNNLIKMIKISCTYHYYRELRN